MSTVVEKKKKNSRQKEVRSMAKVIQQGVGVEV